MVRNIIIAFSVAGIGALGLMAFAGNENESPKQVGTIQLKPTMTTKGAAIKVTVGDLVFFAPSLVLPGQGKARWAEVSPVGGKLLVSRMLVERKATSGTMSVPSLTISTDSEVWRAHAGQPTP
jgi:hypothetical protein